MTDKKKMDYKKILKSLSKNYWTISTVILAILLIAVLTIGGTKGSSISSDTAGEKVVEWASEQVPNVELKSVTEEGGLYAVTFSYANPETSEAEEATLQITKDGSSLILQAIPLTGQVTAPTQTQPQKPIEIPKTDKPNVELYIWSYCPYGVMAQGPLAEVVSLFGEKINAKAILYHDGHGAHETQENKIQECIQKIDGEKYWDYATGFVKDIYPKCGASRDIECDLTESTTLMKTLNINSAQVLSCVETEGTQLMNADITKAQNQGITGSPTLIINGVKVQVDRTSEAFKTAICSAFNEAPAECSETLDSTQAVAQGNC
jgi:hypothetical protein